MNNSDKIPSDTEIIDSDMLLKKLANSLSKKMNVVFNDSCLIVTADGKKFRIKLEKVK